MVKVAPAQRTVITTRSGLIFSSLLNWLLRILSLLLLCSVLTGNLSLPENKQETSLRASLQTELKPTKLVCSSNNGSLITFVLSARENHRRRDAIRATWGSQAPVLFVLGSHTTSSKGTPISINAEQSRNGDLLLVSVPDTYQSLPIKLKHALQWVDNSCDDGVLWALKLDDDMFCHIPAIEALLTKFTNPNSPVVLGHILLNEVVKNYGKWAESGYSKPIYPPFPQGSYGYVLSRAVVRNISKRVGTNMASSSSLPALPNYQGEDTSLGIWLSQQTDFELEWLESSHFVNHANCEDTNSFSIGHKMTPEHIKDCWNKVKTVASPRKPSRVHIHTSPLHGKEYVAALQRHEGVQQAALHEAKMRDHKAERARRRQDLSLSLNKESTHD